MTYFSNKWKNSPVLGYPLALAAQQLLVRPRNALFSLCLEKIIFPKADSGKRKGEGLGGTRVVAEPLLHHSTGCEGTSVVSPSASPANRSHPLLQENSAEVQRRQLLIKTGCPQVHRCLPHFLPKSLGGAYCKFKKKKINKKTKQQLLHNQPHC